MTIKTLKQLLDDAVDLASHKTDLICMSSDIRFSHPTVYHNPIDATNMLLTFEPYALDQAAEKLGVPLAYLHKCPPSLQEVNLNYWADKYKSGWQLRLYDQKVRAVLSKEYEPVDNATVMNALIAAIGDTRYQLDATELDRDNMFLRFLFNDKDIKGNNFKVGVTVQNDEVGDGALKLLPFVQKTQCTNSIQKRDGGFIMRHVRSTTAFITGVLKEKIGKLFGVSTDMLEMIVQADVDRIPNLSEVIRKISIKHNLNDSIQSYIYMGVGQSNTRMGLVDGLSYAAHAANTRAEKTKLEEMAGAALYSLEAVYFQAPQVESSLDA